MASFHPSGLPRPTYTYQWQQYPLMSLVAPLQLLPVPEQLGLRRSTNNNLSNEKLELLYNNTVKLSTSERTAVIRALNGDLDQIFNYISKSDMCFSKTDVIRLGSAYQGLKVGRADEFDFNPCIDYIVIDEISDYSSGSGCYYGFDGHDEDDFWTAAHTSPQEHQDGKFTNLHTTVDKSLKIVHKQRPLENPGVGYRTITLTGDMLTTFQKFTFPGTSYNWSAADLIPFLVKRRLKELLESALSSETLQFKGTFTLSPAARGPALTLKYNHPSEHIDFPISVDISPAIRCTWSFEELGVNWPRLTYWPSQKTIQLVRARGVLYVAKQNFFWRLSFAECEKELCKAEDCRRGCRKKVHCIMKYLQKELWCTRANPIISSYIMKNVWLWEMEKYPHDDDWDDSLLNIRLFGCIRRLITYVRKYLADECILPQYFDPRHNLLEGKDEAQLAKECDEIEQFCNNPQLPVLSQ